MLRCCCCDGFAKVQLQRVHQPWSLLPHSILLTFHLSLLSARSGGVLSTLTTPRKVSALMAERGRGRDKSLVKIKEMNNSALPPCMTALWHSFVMESLAKFGFKSNKEDMLMISKTPRSSNRFLAPLLIMIFLPLVALTREYALDIKYFRAVASINVGMLK